MSFRHLTRQIPKLSWRHFGGSAPSDTKSSRINPCSLVQGLVYRFIGFRLQGLGFMAYRNLKLYPELGMP